MYNFFLGLLQMVKKSVKGGAGNNLNTFRRSANNLNTVKVVNSGSSGNNTMMIIGVVLLVIVLCVAGYFLYSFLKQSKNKKSKSVTKELIPYIHDASIDKDYTGSSIPDSSEGNEYNINVWLYVNDYTYRNGEDKSVIFKGSKPIGEFNAEKTNPNNKNSNPGIWFLKDVNTLRVSVGLDTKYGEECGCLTTATTEAITSGVTPPSTDNGCLVNEGTDTEICDVPYFPLQKWVNLNVSLSNNVLDIFMNGKLVKSCILSGQPTLNKGNLYVCRDGGFNGYISNLKYSNKVLPLPKIKSLYKSGPTFDPNSKSMLGKISSMFS